MVEEETTIISIKKSLAQKLDTIADSLGCQSRPETIRTLIREHEATKAKSK